MGLSNDQTKELLHLIEDIIDVTKLLKEHVAEIYIRLKALETIKD
jgi:hypothetical protein